MVRWPFRLFALPLIAGALSLAIALPDAAHAETVPLNTQNYGAIARTALSMLNQNRGQCFPWVRSVVQMALGRVMGNDYHEGYLQAGAIEVPLVSARNGDIIQIANPANTRWDADYDGLHTAIVLDNLGGGKFRVVDSNSNWDGIVRVRDNYVPTDLRRQGTVVRVYRIEGAPGVVTPSAPVAPTFASTRTLPVVGERVTIAADGDCLRVRSAPGLGGGILGCLPTGAQVTVTQAGPAADGYRWVQVNGGSVSGWAAADYLSAGVTSAVGSVPVTPVAAAAVPAPSPTTATTPAGPPPIQLSVDAPVPQAAPAPVAVASPRFAARPLYGAGAAQASAVFMGGEVDDLITAAREAEASGVWVQDRDGGFQLLIVGGPSFMVDAFRAKVIGFNGPTAVTLIGNAS